MFVMRVGNDVQVVSNYIVFGWAIRTLIYLGNDYGLYRLAEKHTYISIIDMW